MKSNFKNCTMRNATFGILIVLQVCVLGIEYNFDAEIRHFAVGNEKIYVSTDSHLYQMRFDLSEDQRKETSNLSFTNSVNLLQPFESNKTLIVCGTFHCGYCEVLNMSDISQTIYRENISVGPFENQSSVAFLVEFMETNQAYMLIAKTSVTEVQKKYKHCSIDDGVTLRSTLHSQPGEIFSASGRLDQAKLNVNKNVIVKWVDGFQTTHHSYLFGNVNSRSISGVVILRMNNSISKTSMIKSTASVKLACCQDKPRAQLVSSALISSESSLLWTGIFTAQEEKNPEKTALVIYKIDDINLEKIHPEFTFNPPKVGVTFSLYTYLYVQQRCSVYNC